MPYKRTTAALSACAVLLLSSSCAKPGPPASSKLAIAAAANLTGVLDEVGTAFQNRTGIRLVVSYGSTAQLARQIENGAPFDVFASADTEHVDQLIGNGLLAKDSRAIYARGQLALWIPDGERLGVHEMRELVRPDVRFIAIAQPGLAPYGKAAVEAITALELWNQLEPKLVYASNINMARQYAETGNANAAFTAYSLVMKGPGTVVKIDPKLYTPIDQALGVLTSSRLLTEARQFTGFLLGNEGRKILGRAGYL